MVDLSTFTADKAQGSRGSKFVKERAVPRLAAADASIASFSATSARRNTRVEEEEAYDDDSDQSDPDM